ncbi:MAG: PilT/PilU family type 4a pilus ATPase [Verrucomicrobia bacterium]|nr:PilT/PilU family type 4a pilus ATPase [Verrucomicrobiota bacterium]
MKNEVKWFASLCAQEGVINEKLAGQLAISLPADAEVEAFAQLLTDKKLVADATLVDRLIVEAKEIAASGAEAPALALPAAPAPVAAPAPAKPVSVPQASSSSPAAAPVMAPAPVKVTASPGGKTDFNDVKAMTTEQLKAFMLELLGRMQTLGASDLHLSAGSPPFMRNLRMLDFLSPGILSAEDAHRLNTCLLAPDQAAQFEKKRDFDYALAMEGGRRIRVNLMVQKDGVTGTYRIVPERLRTPTELGFKNIDVLKRLLSYHNGLILVTGPVGAGKTTTLNSLIDELNRTREEHIITVEDPIEFLHVSRGCNVTQRQAGQHTETFATALKSALREDPDVIVIGELRDLETIEMAITASETGHLVIGTMHTSDATTTLNRLLDVFPPSQQPQIRAMVAESLRGIICQRLLPAKAGGVVLACELLVNTLAVSAMVRDGKTQGIPSALDTGRREGMISMDNAIFELWEEKKISDETAAANILNRVIRQRIPGVR